MLLAVKFYGQTDNPQGIPPEWPCESFPIASEEECPEGYTCMNKIDYDAHLKTHESAKEAWNEQLYASRVD